MCACVKRVRVVWCQDTRREAKVPPGAAAACPCTLPARVPAGVPPTEVMRYERVFVCMRVCLRVCGMVWGGVYACVWCALVGRTASAAAASCAAWGYVQLLEGGGVCVCMFSWCMVAWCIFIHSHVSSKTSTPVQRTHTNGHPCRQLYHKNNTQLVTTRQPLTLH